MEPLEVLSSEQIERVAEFLLRPASILGNNQPTTQGQSVLDHLIRRYDGHSLYEKRTDYDHIPLEIGDYYIDGSALAVLILNAIHRDHDPYGLFGEKTTGEGVDATEPLSVGRDDHRALMTQLDKAINTIRPGVHIAIDYFSLANNGIAVAPIASARATDQTAASPGKDVIAETSIFGEEVRLIHDSGGFKLLMAGEAVEISKTEAKIFINTDSARLAEFVHGEAVSRSQTLGSVLSAGLRKGLYCSFVDQTLFENALDLTKGGAPTPVKLLDLSTLTHQLVFADTVAVSGRCEVPTKLAEVVTRCGDDQFPIGHELARLAHRIQSSDSVEADGIDAMSKCWSDFLSVEVAIDPAHISSCTNSPNVWSYNIGDSGFVDLLDPINGILFDLPLNERRDQAALNQAVSVQTYRYILNERRAALMGVSYAPSTLRYPAHVVSLRNSTHFQRATDRLSPLHARRDFDPGDPLLRHLRLPYVLGTVLQSARSSEEVLDATLGLREQVAPFRERRYQLTEEGLTDIQALRKLLNELGGVAWTSKADSAVRLGANIATATGLDLGTGLLIMKVGSKVGVVDQIKRFWDSVTKPELKIVRSFTAELDSLQASTADVERVFGHQINRGWLESAARFADLSPYAYSSLSEF